MNSQLPGIKLCAHRSKPGVDAFGAQENCFNLAPRWLGPPNEILSNLASRNKQWDPSRIVVTHMTSSLKCFSTAWVAPLPLNRRLSGWHASQAHQNTLWNHTSGVSPSGRQSAGCLCAGRCHLLQACAALAD